MTEIMRKVQGTEAVRWQERGVVAAGREVYHAAQLRSIQVDAHAALTAHAMERYTDLDGVRRRLAGDDPLLNERLAMFQAIAGQQIANVLLGGKGDGSMKL